MLENYSETDIEKTVWGKIIIDYALSAVLHGINLTENSILRLKDDEKLQDAVEPLLVGDLAYFTLVQLKFVSSSWDEIRQAIFSFETGRMKSPKGYKDNPIKISVSSNRDEVKETVKKLQSLFFGVRKMQGLNCHSFIGSYLPCLHYIRNHGNEHNRHNLPYVRL